MSIGSDHMKYVLDQNQIVTISGYIQSYSNQYNGNYQNDSIILAPDFLSLEHTDGLNYINLEARRHNNLKSLKNISFSIINGFGFGALIPRTDVTLLNNERYDKFHLSGYGLGGVLGLQINLGRHIFILSEAKGGFINMPDIRTTKNVSDKANQNFFFVQSNLVFGFRFNLQ